MRMSEFGSGDLLPGRLLSLTIENFRGVRDRVEFNLDASVVLLWGPNGTGKTTLFDALLWLLQGSLPRLAAQTMRRNEDYVVNAYRRASPATVSARVRSDGQEFEVTRRGFASQNVLEIRGIGRSVTGEPYQLLEKLLLGVRDLPLDEVLATSGLLQQDDLRLLLRDKPDQRYRQLLRLLGLEVLEKFERHLRGRQKDARVATRETQQLLDRQRSRVSELTDEIETVVALIERSAAEQGTVTNTGRLTESLTSLDLRFRELGTSSQWAALQAETSGLMARLSTVIRVIDGLEPEEPYIPRAVISEEALRAAEFAYVAAREAVRVALHELELLQQTEDALDQLARLAIPQLESASDDGRGLVSCPVCLSTVDRAQTIQSLTDRAQVGSIVAAAEARLDAARSSESVAREDRAALQEEQRRIAEVHDLQRSQEEDARTILRELQALRSGPTVVVRGLDDLDIEQPVNRFVANSAGVRIGS